MTDKEFEHTIMPLAENVYSYAVNMLGNPDDAADITQDVMAKLWETRHQLHSMESPKAWALRMTRNLCLDHLKRRRPILDEEAVIRNGGFADDLQRQVEAKDMADIVRQIIDTLPDNQREVLLLREVQEMEFDEIARITGLGLNNIRTLLSRGRAKVKEALKLQRYDDIETWKFEN